MRGPCDPSKYDDFGRKRKVLSPNAGAGKSGYEAAEESGEPAQCPGRAGGVLLGCAEPSGAPAVDGVLRPVELRWVRVWLGV